LTHFVYLRGHDGTAGRIHGGFFGSADSGAQAEALRIPQADGMLLALPVREDDTPTPSLLTLSDVMGTGHHTSVAAPVAGKNVAIIGDGAVGLWPSHRCEAPRRPSRSSSWVVTPTASRSRANSGRPMSSARAVREAVERVGELTGGFAVHSVVECVGTDQAMLTAVGMARPDGVHGRRPLRSAFTLCSARAGRPCNSAFRKNSEYRALRGMNAIGCQAICGKDFDVSTENTQIRGCCCAQMR
jgi:threonine dehydrogenase-like Zn-dependent dehydrogenase